MHATGGERQAERLHVKGMSWDKVDPKRLTFVCDHGECQFCDDPNPLGKTHILEINLNAGFVACTQCKSDADKRWSMFCETETWNKYVRHWMDKKDTTLTISKLDDWDQVAGEEKKKQPTTGWVFSARCNYMRRGSAAGSTANDLYVSVLHEERDLSSWVLWTQLVDWNPKLLLI